MTARLYSNENFHRLAVEALRELGHDVLTCLKAGRSNRRIADDEVLQFATGEGRAVLTFNRLHFIRLHRSTEGRHAGIVVCSEDHDVRALAQRIDQAIQEAGSVGWPAFACESARLVEVRSCCGNGSEGNGILSRFVLKAQNGELIGRSEMYSSAAARDNGIALVQKNCTSDVVKDLT